MKKIIIGVIVVILSIVGIFFINYYNSISKAINKENFDNFTLKKYEQIKNFPENNLYYNIFLLNNKDLTIEQLSNIISSSKSNIIKEQAILRKSELLLKNKELKLALNILNDIKSDIYLPFVSLIKGDIFKEMKRPNLAKSEYAIAYQLFKEDLYKVLILEKIKIIENESKK